MLLASWWKSMKESGLPGGEEDSDPGKETLDELGIQAMSAAVAQGGGIGIGALLVRSLLSNAAKSANDSSGRGLSNGGGVSPGGVVHRQMWSSPAVNVSYEDSTS
jgi:Rod binding domain-containing protein